MSSYDSVLKFLVIGDSGVGKTCVLLRFCDDTFTNVHLITIGIDFKLKNIDIDGKKIKLQIWDTAGQERFKTITQNYYKGAMGIILCYSVTDKETFVNIAGWMRQISEHADENVCKILIGNKSDMPNRQVSFEEGQQLASQYNIKFFETSAKEGTNVNDAFMSIATEAYKKLNDEPQDKIFNNRQVKNQQLHGLNTNGGVQKKKSWCPFF